MAEKKEGEKKTDSKPLAIFGYALELPDYAFIAVALIILIMNFSLVSGLSQIPSPPYGGDYYNGLGGVYHILSGGSLFASAQMVGEVPWVPWFYHLCVAIFAMLTGGDAIKALVNFSLPMAVISAIIGYLFVSKITGNKYLAIAGTIIFLRVFPIFKYSDFSAWVMVPAFVLVLYEFVKNQNLKNAAIAGVLLGLASLSNTQAFFVSFLVFGLVFLVFFLPRIYREKKIVMDAGALESLKLYAAIFAIGFALSLLFWYWPLFVFHGSTPNPIQDITTPDTSNPTYLWGTIIDYSLKPLFVPYGGGVEIVFSLLTLAGVAYLLINRQSDENRFALVLLGAALICAFHPLVTIPLFNKQLVNFMLVYQLEPVLQALLIPAGLLLVFVKVQKEKARMILVCVLILLSAWLFLEGFDAKGSDQWMAYGKQPLAPEIAEMSAWIRSNTNVNDVFLTTNEDGFMMNAVTGRKVLSYRRSHSSPYTDVNTRMADQAVIVYGSDETKARALLKKYNVKYLLWTNRWILNEFNFDAQGKMTGLFDPLDIPDNASNRAYWDSAGVRHINQTISLDPAPRPGAPEYKVLIAVPYAMDMDVPYNPALLDDFVLKKTIQYNGQDAFRIYEIKSG